jgi:apolipoprotein N-acyltransferase
MKRMGRVAVLLGPLISSWLVYALCAAVIPGWLGAWVFLVPWLALQLEQATCWRAAGVAALFGVVSSALVLNGAQHYGFWVFALGVLGMSSQFVLFGVGAHLLLRSCARSGWIPLGLALLYVVLDVVYSRMTFLASARLAGVLAFAPFWLSLVAVTGSAGLTFALVYINVALAQVLAAGRRGRGYGWCEWRGRGLSVVGIIVLLSAFGCWGRVPADSKSGERSTFAVVQGGIRHEEYREAYRNPLIRRAIWERYTALTEEAIAAGHGHVLWPEGALDVPLRKVEGELARFLRIHPCLLTAGFYEIEGTNRYNSVVTLDATGRVRDRYRKHLLIPLAEARHRREERVKNLAMGEGTVATPICYEALFPDYVRALVNGGAQAIFVFTDESGLGRESTSTILLGQGVLRAVENRRYLVRVSQSGLSALIDPWGRIVVRSDQGTAEILTTEVVWREDRSIYTRFGDWFAWLSALVLPWVWWKTGQPASDRG